MESMMIITTRRREVRALFCVSRQALEAECERIEGTQRAAAAWLALMYVLERRAVDNDWSGVDAMVRKRWA
jgi:hypothetical protein